MGVRVDKLAHTDMFNIGLGIFKRGESAVQVYYCKKCFRILKVISFPYEEMSQVKCYSNPMPLQVVFMMHCR
jgi:hypothetical protein